MRQTADRQAADRSTDAPAEEVPITVETDLDAETSEKYYQLYRETFGELETVAVARQLLRREEFIEEMHDPRVHKYVAWDGDRVIGMTTVTNHLETVPWISPAYFRHHYPEEYERGAVYYVGFTLVDRQHRTRHVFQAMIHRMCELFLAKDAVVGWDICAHNDDGFLFGDVVSRVVARTGRVQVAPVDRQTYYAGYFGAAAARETP